MREKSVRIAFGQRSGREQIKYNGDKACLTRQIQFHGLNLGVH